MQYSGNQYGRRAILMPEITPVVKMLLIANGALFFFTYLSHDLTIFFIKNFSLIPYTVTHHFQVWRLVSYMFLHGGFTHLLFNMLFLWWFGSELEILWGPKLFIKYYFITGLGGGLFHLVQPNSPIPVIGASAAIMGIMLAYGLKWPDRKILIWFVLPVKMKWLVLFSLIVAFLGSVNMTEGYGIAHLAHLGGMVVGFLYLNWNRILWKMRDLRYRKKREQRYKKFTILDGKKKDDLDDFFDDNNNDHTVH